MNNFKFFGATNSSLVNISYVFSKDIGMESGVKMCFVLILKRK